MAIVLDKVQLPQHMAQVSGPVCTEK